MTPSLRSAHAASCSAAAARNVSPGTNITLAPLWLAKRCDNLPTVVVFPPPLTPTTRITEGAVSHKISGAAPSFPPLERCRISTMAALSALFSSGPVLISPASTRSLMASRILVVVAGPKSTDKSVSSSSSKVSSRLLSRSMATTSSTYDSLSRILEVPLKTRSKSPCVFLASTAASFPMLNPPPPAAHTEPARLGKVRLL
mmetsp:Transcript_28193/g.45197  ORF Transcript_28193/g.45197 Transcript_28193/m.45197 type:complete len:201 (+) Transcript_28193:551-1153(+)